MTPTEFHHEPDRPAEDSPEQGVDRVEGRLDRMGEHDRRVFRDDADAAGLAAGVASLEPADAEALGQVERLLEAHACTLSATLSSERLAAMAEAAARTARTGLHERGPLPFVFGTPARRWAAGVSATAAALAAVIGGVLMLNPVEPDTGGRESHTRLVADAEAEAAELLLLADLLESPFFGTADLTDRLGTLEQDTEAFWSDLETMSSAAGDAV